jgi:hypothetical protein
MKKPREPYDKRTDLEKLQSQWWKLSGLQTREEWSAAVVRAATAAEIAANIAIRSEFQRIGNFPPSFVDSLLLWANGLGGKIDKLLVPITKEGTHADVIATLKSSAIHVNKIRNGIAHRGEFCNREKAQEAIERSREFVNCLVALYHPGFQLEERK